MQSNGVLFSDFCSLLKAKDEEAELENLSTEEIYVFRLICGTTDAKFKGSFLKIENPKLEDLHKASRA